MARTAEWDFFISYTNADRQWAEWIAWTMESAGYRVLIQAWDMVPGTNWVFAVDQGVRRAQRTIAVTSRAYLESEWGQLESLGALRRDPLGRQRRVLVVRVEECHPESILGMIGRIDVFGMPEAEARGALLAGVEQAVRGRGKPDAPGGFPGHGSEARFPGVGGDASDAGEHRICLALDVDGYRQLAAGQRERVRARLLEMLFATLGRAGVRNDACVVIDRVDGLAVILPVGFTGPTATAALAEGLCRGVAGVGRAAAGEPPIRIRVGVAAGTVNLNSRTFEGPGMTMARRLASSVQVRTATVISARTPNAVIVADDLYQEATASVGMTGEFARIPVSADGSGWIALIAGTRSAPASGQAPEHVAAGTAPAAAAGLITGGLAAAAWHLLLDQFDHEDALTADPFTGGHVGAPALDRDSTHPPAPVDHAEGDHADPVSHWDHHHETSDVTHVLENAVHDVRDAMHEDVVHEHDVHDAHGPQ